MHAIKAILHCLDLVGRHENELLPIACAQVLRALGGLLSAHIVIIIVVIIIIIIIISCGS
jgi:hypothetical protein